MVRTAPAAPVVVVRGVRLFGSICPDRVRPRPRLAAPMRRCDRDERQPMATVETRTRDEQETPVLKRHVGVVGLLFASVGSIIGSGWLFGALNASQQAGPAVDHLVGLRRGPDPADRARATPSWARCSRCPAAWSASRTWRSATSRASRAGWITYVAVAHHGPDRGRGGAAVRHPVRRLHRRSTWSTARPVYTLTALGYAAAVVLMAVFVVINYYGVRWFARINNALVSGGSSSSSCSSSSRSSSRPSTASNFSSPRVRAVGLARRLHRHRHRAGSCSPTSASGRASSSRARPTTPSATCRSRSSGRCCITGRHLRPAAGRLHRRARPGDPGSTRAAGPTCPSRTTSARSPPSPRPSAWAGWRCCSTSTRSSPPATPA